MEEKRFSLVPALVALLLMLPVLYVGSYFALVQSYASVGPVNDLLVENPTYIVISESPFPHYRGLGNRGRTFFAPIHSLDRTLRPNKWAVRTNEYPIVLEP